MFDYIAIALTRKRRVGDPAEKSDLETVIADNIQATRDLAETITRYDTAITRLNNKAEREGEEYCEYDHPKCRASDRW